MSATIIGSPSASSTATNAKVLRRQNFQREISGLEILQETYIIQTANRSSLIPAKDATHSSFSTASIKYPRMAVETASFSEQDGDLTEMNVTFVGLTSSSGLPQAVVRILPVTGAGVFGPPINIEAEFVTDSVETQLLDGKFSSTSPIIEKGFRAKRRMPKFINGTRLPENPLEPFNKSNTAGFSGGGITIVTDFQNVYEGYVVKDIDCTRRGQFLVARITFEEYVFYSSSSG